tara:strand:+ start:213 stop:836 length:624 start_codon:yes stop_codon:yes gene_type:complete
MIFRLSIKFALILFLGNFSASGQWTKKEARFWQKKMNTSFKSDRTSPLEECQRVKFKRLPFYRINKKLAINASWIRCHDSSWFEMETTTNRRPIYRRFAKLSFYHKGEKYSITAFQPQKLHNEKGYENYLFIPFGDATNGHKTYGGGRYVEVNFTNADFLLLDFNKSYNPYCAYSNRYSCPKVPLENILNITINAGVKYNADKFHKL